MSVWRKFLKALLPFLFREAAVAADAAIEGKDVKEAVLADAKNADLSPVIDAAREVADKTIDSVTK